MDACWPFRRFVRARCGDCNEQVIVLPGFETVTIGVVSLLRDPELVPSGTVEPEDYRATWSSSGLRINIGEQRWTVRASTSDLTQ